MNYRSSDEVQEETYQEWDSIGPLKSSVLSASHLWTSWHKFLQWTKRQLENIIVSEKSRALKIDDQTA